MTWEGRRVEGRLRWSGGGPEGAERIIFGPSRSSQIHPCGVCGDGAICRDRDHLSTIRPSDDRDVVQINVLPQRFNARQRLISLLFEMEASRTFCVA